MFHVVLYQPEIPPNTGNVIRLCANSGASLHLIKPLGFTLDDAKLRRAGLDYHEFAAVQVHDSLQEFRDAAQPLRVFGLSTRGTITHAEVNYQPGDAFVFGPETRGLPDDVRAWLGAERLLRIPLMPGNRSLNLSNAVAIVVYEAWRQQGYVGAPNPARE